MEVVTRWWLRFANAAGAFMEEAAARVALAWAVLRGKSPKPLQRRTWNRGAETPVLVDAFDWTNDRRVFSVLVWPSLESPPETADDDMRERTEQVLDAIARGASERMWSTRWEIDYGLRWDAKRQVWAGADGFQYEPPTRVGARGGGE